MVTLKRKSKAKEKRGIPHFKGEIIKRFPQEIVETKRKSARDLILLGCFGLIMAGVITVINISEYQFWQYLESEGQSHRAALLKLERYTCGQAHTCAYATYQYNGITRREEIDGDLYRDLQGKTEVPIIAAGSTIRIANAKPNTTENALIVCFGSLTCGVLPLSVGVFRWFTFNLRPRRRHEAGLWPYSW
jgi:hypothetical protein